MRFQSGRTRRATGRGFTLVELLLTLALILLLAAAAVFNFSSLQRGAHLDEGALQFEALLRFARAQATTTGRIIQVTYDESANGGSQRDGRVLRLKWEPDPLGAPGIFEDLPHNPRFVEAIGDDVGLLDIRLLDGSSFVEQGWGGLEPMAGTNGAADFSASATNRIAAFTADEASSVPTEARILPPTVNFYPDGSSDSAEFLLASRDEEDPRRLLLRMIGLTGTIERHRVLREGEAPEEPEEPVEEAPAEPASELTHTEAPTP